MNNKRIKDFKDGSEIVGYYRNFGHDVSITVNEVKEYAPKNEWFMLMSEAVEELKELNRN